MSEIKYQYAYDETGKLVSINDYTKDSSKLHTFRCVGCGNALLPRAIGSKSRRAHFYHKEIIECSGETYIHKLAKRLIKEKFDNASEFFMEYRVEKDCSNRSCRLRNINCHKDYERNLIDLKRYYDTCTEEAHVNGFFADLLLSNSRRLCIQPLLIDICVTHACDQTKLDSGLKIIEISINKEQEVIDLINKDVLAEEKPMMKKDRVVKFISFKRTLEEPMVSEISRYIFNPAMNESGYITPLSCRSADYKQFAESFCELNIVKTKNAVSNILSAALDWMQNNKRLRRCNFCKYYRYTWLDNVEKCHLNKKYGKPMFPKMTDAETCSKYHRKDNHAMFESERECYYIEEVIVKPINGKETFRVIIAGSSSFNDEKLFKEKCDYYLGTNLEIHNITVISGTSSQTQELIKKYAFDNDLIVEPHEAEWGKYGNSASHINNQNMLSNADALIAFWDGKGTKTGALINNAKDKGIKVVVVPYKSDDSNY